LKHPAFAPFVTWLGFVVSAVVAALLSGSPLWLLLGVPALGWATLLAGGLIRGDPTQDVEETQRLDRMLIEVGGEDAFAVSVQDQVDLPVVLRHRKQPAIYAAADFVRHASDDVLRGVAALQHAALRHQPAATGPTDLTIRRPVVFVVVVGVAFVVGLISSETTGPAGAIAAAGFTLWLFTAISSARASVRRNPSAHPSVDAIAVQIAGDPRFVADALVALSAWLREERSRRSAIARIAHRIVVPIRPNLHEAERAAALRASA
jgi:hypothetical protein